MKIVLVVVGKTSTPWVTEGLDYFLEKLKHYAPFELLTVPDIKAGKTLTQEMQKERESSAVLASLQPSDQVMLLDERGKEMTSVGFSQTLQAAMLAGTKRLVFVIGGPYGFSQTLYNRANGLLSLSKMTLTHEMARLFFVEQLYRAQTILKGQPYHHN